MVYNKEKLEEMYGGPLEKVLWDLGKPYRQLIEFVNENQPCRALDAGCGTGTDAIFLAKNGFEVSAIDISEKAIEIAKNKAEKEGVSVDFVVGDVLNMPFKDETFEFVNDNGCFHLLDKSKWNSFVKEVHRVMKPQGKILMKCFSDKEPENPKILYRLSKVDIKHYFSNFFDIVYIRPVIIEGKHGDHQGYSCLMLQK